MMLRAAEDELPGLVAVSLGKDLTWIVNQQAIVCQRPLGILIAMPVQLLQFVVRPPIPGERAAMVDQKLARVEMLMVSEMISRQNGDLGAIRRPSIAKDYV